MRTRNYPPESAKCVRVCVCKYAQGSGEKKIDVGLYYSPTRFNGALQLWQKHCSTESRTRVISILFFVFFLRRDNNAYREIISVCLFFVLITSRNRGNAKKVASGVCDGKRVSHRKGWLLSSF